MKEKMFWMFLGGVVLVLGFGVSNSWGNVALRDLKPISIHINDLDLETRKTGLDEQFIKDMVWQVMEKEGLALPPNASGKGNPNMHVFITAIRVMGGYAVSYRMHLRDWMIIPRSPSTRVQVTTWERGGILSGKKKKIRSEVDQELKKLTHLFVMDYLRANQKGNT